MKKMFNSLTFWKIHTFSIVLKLIFIYLLCAYVILVKPKLNGNLNIPHGKICSMVFLFFRLLTTLSYFHHKTLLFLIKEDYLHCLIKIHSHIIKLSFVLEQTFCQVYIRISVNFSESCLHTHRRFLEKFLSLAIFRDPLLFQEQCCLIWGFYAVQKQV